MITIYHNPRCSKSREALAMVEHFATMHGLPISIVEYLQTPLSVAQLSTLRNQLGDEAHAMVRDNEPEYAESHLATASEAELLNAIANNPRLLQRPIVVYQERAMIGRPPERLANLLQSA